MILREGVKLEDLSVELVKRLELAEVFTRRAFEITSGFRKGDDRTHGLGEAVDIACGDSSERWKMVSGLLRASGLVRIGLYSAHIHVDVGSAVSGYPQEVLWLGGASK